jgi:plastocyanin
MKAAGGNIWILNGTTGRLTALKAADGSPALAYETGAEPVDFAFDGEYFWVTSSRDGNVGKIRASDGKLAGSYPESGQPPAGFTPPSTRPTVVTGAPRPSTLVVTTQPAGTPTVTISSTDEIIRVVIKMMWVQPPIIVVPVGSTVTWFNEDEWDHTVTSDTGLFDGYLKAKTGSFSYTFREPGTYGYHCTLHNPDRGIVIVR